MNNLSDDQLLVLQMLEATEKESTHKYILNNIEGEEYFEKLKQIGYFDYQKPPKDHELNYLLKTLKNSKDISDEFKESVFSFIFKISIANLNFANHYRPWWYCAQILEYVPEFITTDFIEKGISKWLSDKYTISNVIKELGENVLSALMEAGKKNEALLLFKEIIELKEDSRSYKEGELTFRVDSYWVSRVLKKQIDILVKLNADAIITLEDKLIEILSNKENEDQFSIMWRPAIEEHEQNDLDKYDSKNVIITTLRDLIIQLDIEISEEIIFRYLKSDKYVFKRIGLHALNIKWDSLSKHNFDVELTSDEFFNDYCRHELFLLLKERFDDFGIKLQESVLDYIKGIDNFSDEKYKEHQIAFKKLNWLTALKNSSNEEAVNFYNEVLAFTGTEPENPDFAFYMKSGFVGNKSPYTERELAEIAKKDVNALVNSLNKFEEENRSFDGPTKRGLADTFQRLLKENFQVYKSSLNEFINLDDTYLAELIRFFHTFENEEEKTLDDLSISIRIDFCKQILVNRHELFKKEYSPTVDEINRWLTEINRNDEKVKTVNDYQNVEFIIETELKYFQSSESRIGQTNNRVSLAINSNKGKVLELLINHSLMRCRQVNPENDRENEQHKKIWIDLYPTFNNCFKDQIYDSIVSAIFAKYLPNLLYLSYKWTENEVIPKLFKKNKDDRESWLGAVDGYAYSKYLDQVFDRIIEWKLLSDILNLYDENEIEHSVYNDYINSTVIHYLRNEQSTEAVKILFSRNNDEELANTIHFIWRIRDKMDEKFMQYSLGYWKLVIGHIRDNPENDYTKTLSNGNLMISLLDDDIEKYKSELLTCAPFVSSNHHQYPYLEELMRVSKKGYSKLSAELLIEMIKNEIPIGHKEDIKQLLEIFWESSLEEQMNVIGELFFESGYDWVINYTNDLKM